MKTSRAKVTDATVSKGAEGILENFIQSFPLAKDGREVLAESMKVLPDLRVSPSALPKTPPSLFNMDIWY